MNAFRIPGLTLLLAGIDLNRVQHGRMELPLTAFVA